MLVLTGKAAEIGRPLAKGSYRFCERYGHKELSMSVKKLELPAYDPRTSFSQALCYEMNNRGGCHLQGGYTAPHAYCAGDAEWPADRIEGTPLIAKDKPLFLRFLGTDVTCSDCPGLLRGDDDSLYSREDGNLVRYCQMLSRGSPLPGTPSFCLRLNQS